MHALSLATPPKARSLGRSSRKRWRCSVLEEWHLHSALPAGMCLHAAHSLLPTVLAMNSTDVKEFEALPTVTVRCIKPECGATFQLSPMKSPNGRPRKKKSD